MKSYLTLVLPFLCSWHQYLEFIERVAPVKTSLKIPPSKKPTDYVKEMPQPNRNWPNVSDPSDEPVLYLLHLSFSTTLYECMIVHLLCFIREQYGFSETVFFYECLVYSIMMFCTSARLLLLSDVSRRIRITEKVLRAENDDVPTSDEGVRPTACRSRQSHVGHDRTGKQNQVARTETPSECHARMNCDTILLHDVI